MALRFRRSKKIFPGVRVTLSKSGLGFSIGGKWARITRSPKGKISRTVTLPGTGLSDVETIHNPKNSRKRR